MIVIVNEKLVDYIRSNKSTYSVGKLKAHLVDKGYSQEDVDAAAMEATGNVPEASAGEDSFMPASDSKSKLIDSAKWGAIYGAVAGAILGVTSILSSFLISLRFAFLAGTSGMISTTLGLVSNVFWSAVWGAILGLLLIKFYEKILFETLFKKAFYVRLVIDLVFVLIFSIILNFAGPLALSATLAGTVLSDFAYAKLFANKMEELHGYV